MSLIFNSILCLFLPLFLLTWLFYSDIDQNDVDNLVATYPFLYLTCIYLVVIEHDSTIFDRQLKIFKFSLAVCTLIIFVSFFLANTISAVGITEWNFNIMMFACIFASRIIIEIERLERFYENFNPTKELTLYISLSNPVNALIFCKKAIIDWKNTYNEGRFINVTMFYNKNPRVIDEFIGLWNNQCQSLNSMNIDVSFTVIGTGENSSELLKLKNSGEDNKLIILPPH